ncbi:hypothetical protein [Bifidobacterium scardovii]|uniref:Uncharacterized protein n=1 Tax=Bifidobacterium scardovii TaxID=158787 RepID=A0A087D450_9BIFI|nr:hypothetical protein [Bifidobacterium scardovii]DAK00018.1 MAG TPA: hypothetical protein [Caudoviricetes sp.]KFI90300.1 hypothetical protein BSCA_1911 [Bifidobacterium scardovii]MDK6350015.1 hypothetical protein [Bifidobacterium scardovii]MDU8982136.1 hypothetical protein [Bifidobacterium scardovii]BAQ30467.1 hypothetical protein BBSC_0387 [Bifidobacterium scardovii JCM 12489 = DSM 13734]
MAAKADALVEIDERGNLGELSLRYYGPALDVDHSISAKALAPALLNFADAVEAAKNEMSSESQVELRVKATRPGSFDIQLLLQGIGDFANTAQGQGLEWLATVGGVGFLTILIGAVKFVKYVHEHGEPKIVKTEPLPADEGTTFSEEKVTVKAPDGTFYETYRSSMRIAANRTFVNSAGKALSGPAAADGVDGAELSSRTESVNVDKQTARSMADWTPDEDVINETDSTLTVQPLDAHFEPGKKWHVTVGGETKYTVDMEDPAFIHAVENGKRIGKRDMFVVTMHTISSRGKDGKLKARHAITKVQKHIPYDEGSQGELDI